MKIAGARQLRARSAEYLGGDQPVLVTKHGHVSGVYVPLEHPDRLPQDLRRELADVLGHYLSRLLEHQGVTEKRLEKDFRAYRKRRR